MTNKQIQLKFNEMMKSTDNVFDLYVELLKIENDYKKSDFYKNTKMSIADAFKIHMEYESNLAVLAETLLNPQKTANLEENLKLLTDRLSFESILDEMDNDNKKLFTELLPFINKA